MRCEICLSPLRGRQRRFCSYQCKVKGQSNAVYANQKKRGLIRKNELLVARGGKCQRCGYDRCLRALTFHHRDRASKAFPLDARNCSNRSYALLASEALKCEVLCANCHAETEEELCEQKSASEALRDDVLAKATPAC